MHFASAGVMMLREAGICSRYAEGDFVPSSAWIEQENGTWSAEVKDSNAHAWAGIYQAGGDNKDSYLSDCWIPVEMTPAYDGELAGGCRAAGGVWFSRKVKQWREYRMLHTGEERQAFKI